MLTREIQARTILGKTGISAFKYCVNPYVGCQHGCQYCYASFMKRFTGHLEPWGDFVDVKINAPEVLRRQLKRAKKGKVWVSSVTDAYQPLEKKYKLTRGCLEALLEVQFPVSILTRSPLCLRDIDLFKSFKEIEIGFSIGTDSETVMRAFEPHSPAIKARIAALHALHAEGLRTYAFIGPILPMHPDRLVERLSGAVDSVTIDRMNYSNRSLAIYRRHKWERYLSDEYFAQMGSRLQAGFSAAKIGVFQCF